MEEIKNELKKLALEMIQSDNDSIDHWLKSVSALYEKLLVLKYLNERDAHLADIRSEVEKEISKITQQASPPEISVTEAAAPEKVAENEIDPSVHSEIRVVPHPEGPPVSMTEEPAPKAPAAEKKTEQKTAKKSQPAPAKMSIAEKAAEQPKKSLNDQLSNKSLKFGLNDRIAFIKHLFNGSAEDFQRVVSQLNTFETMGEVEDFINHLVKPEYGWSDKEEFEERFMNIINARFE